jgi:hypothetical protein
MKEIKNIIKAFDEAQVNGKQTALATVVACRWIFLSATRGADVGDR